MSKITLILILLTFLSGCFDDREVTTLTAPRGYLCITEYGTEKSYSCPRNTYFYRWNCNKEKQAQFIIDCAKAANPMSDEEGEDLVEQCEKTSHPLFCEKEYYEPAKKGKGK